MVSSGDGEIVAKMLQAAKRVIDAIVERAAPLITETHREFPREIREHIGSVQHIDGQLASEFDRVGPGRASWLDARLFARRNLDSDMSVELMQEVHHRLRIRHDPEGAGRMQGARRFGTGTLTRPLSRSELAAVEENPLLTHVPGPFSTEPHGVVLQPRFEGQPGARDVRWLSAPPTAAELAAIADDPLLAYLEPRHTFRGGTLAEHGLLIYSNFGSVDGTYVFHESLCARYNDALRAPGVDPYEVSAEFEKRLISGHSWEGPNHGRHGRILMNFGLEKAGEPPSAVADFDNDLFSSSSQWTEQVKAGSDRYRQWQGKLEHSGGDIDPIDLFDLGPMVQRYQEMGGEPSPFTPGEWHDGDKYERLHRHLRLGR